MLPISQQLKHEIHAVCQPKKKQKYFQPDFEKALYSFKWGVCETWSFSCDTSVGNEFQESFFLCQL